ncbi:unnamed protein product [Protopolystoma xenopodis]|uniref:Uncharacterized protein n=1 Tax=Protopolystoma xenopodis TaxID=117903 RepID=A0A3S5FGI5_9PLAT|nr:unnamed protein product [Protopolystoma xenopodis]
MVVLVSFLTNRSEGKAVLLNVCTKLAVSAASLAANLSSESKLAEESGQAASRLLPISELTQFHISNEGQSSATFQAPTEQMQATIPFEPTPVSFMSGKGLAEFLREFSMIFTHLTGVMCLGGCAEQVRDSSPCTKQLGGTCAVIIDRSTQATNPTFTPSSLQVVQWDSQKKLQELSRMFSN